MVGHIFLEMHNYKPRCYKYLAQFENKRDNIALVSCGFAKEKKTNGFIISPNSILTNHIIFFDNQISTKRFPIISKFNPSLRCIDRIVSIVRCNRP